MLVWQPILEGELAEDARRTVIDIARAFTAEGGRRPKITDAPLFWAYLAGAIDEPWIAEAYDRSVDVLAEHASRGFTDISLYGGAAAAGFTIAHISEPGTAEDSLGGIDRLLAAALAGEHWSEQYDLISGLAGVGVYLLERGDAPVARAVLDRLIGHLLATREVTPHGSTWHTRPDLLPARQRAMYPDGYYNCGVAHGVPGVIALLGRVAPLDPKYRALAEDVLRWLDHEATDGRYPSWFAAGDSRIPARTAWCYGDPGVAVAMWGARERLGLSVEPARALAERCTTRSLAESYVEDAGICHGAAGLAHLFNRCFQASDAPVFRDAARTWFGHVLAMRRADGLGGFLAWTEGPDGEPAWLPATSLLEGATGIALALLAALEPNEPSWDRLLLADLPLAAARIVEVDRARQDGLAFEPQWNAALDQTLEVRA